MGDSLVEEAQLIEQNQMMADHYVLLARDHVRMARNIHRDMNLTSEEYEVRNAVWMMHLNLKHPDGSACDHGTRKRKP